MILFVVPIGIGAAIYLEEYADKTRWWNRLIEVNIQNLAAVPSIIYGILGLAFIVRGPLDLGFILVAGSLTLALLVLPMVIIAAREAIRAVPDSIRQGSLALGATKWQTIRRQVLPASIPGIATGVILAVSRALGETAPLLLVGATVFVTFDPTPFSADGYSAMPVQIFNYAVAAPGGVPGAGRGRNHRHAGRPAGDELLRDLATKSLRAEVVGGSRVSEQMTTGREQSRRRRARRARRRPSGRRSPCGPRVPAAAPAGQREKVFELKGVDVLYSGVTAVKGISMDIHRNDVTALIGPSGCGKSTLLRCLNRMNDLIPGAEVRGRAALPRRGPLRRRASTRSRSAS